MSITRKSFTAVLYKHADAKADIEQDTFHLCH